MRLLHRIIENNRIALSFIAGGLFIYFATPTTTAILIGAPFIFLGEAIRTWASGFIKKDEVLAQDGPYSLSRNPLYLGNFFIGFGFGIMANNLLLLAFFLILFPLIYRVTIKNEEKNLLNKFGDSFLEYKRRVPVFFPRLSLRAPVNPPFSPNPPISPLLNGGEGGGAFDWHLVVRHKEHHTWLGITGSVIVFIVKALL